MAATSNSNISAGVQARGGSQKGPALFRVGGSGFTVFHWQGQPIGFAQAVSMQSPQPVAAPVAIQPMDQQYPLQIITPAAIGPGTLVLQMYETYNSKIWDAIMAIVDKTNTTGLQTNKLPVYNDLVEVFIRLANIGKGINCTKIIYPPNKVQGGTKSQFYADTYHNCTITDIRDDESIDIGAMEIVKNMTIQYTYSTRTSASA